MMNADYQEEIVSQRFGPEASQDGPFIKVFAQSLVIADPESSAQNILSREDGISSPIQNNIEVQQQKQAEPSLQVILQKTMLTRFRDQLYQAAHILPKNLNQVQQEIIESFMIFPSQQLIQKRQFISKVFVYFEKKVFSPTSMLIIIWDIISLLLQVYSLWLAVFTIAFSDYDSQQCSIMVIMMSLYQMIDVFINCNKAFLLQGELICDRSTIIKHYVQDYFYKDIMIALVWVIYQVNSNIPFFIEILGIIQIILTIRRIQKKYIRYYEQISIKGGGIYIVDLIVLFLQIYFCTHIAACIWYYVGSHTAFLGNNWLMSRNIEDSSKYIQYNQAFYWATMTMVTVGYGDILPQNYAETITASAIMLVSSCIFGYSMNGIGLILNNMRNAKQEYNLKLLKINAYMKQNQVEASVQSKIRNFLKFYSQQQEQNEDDELKALIEQLPKALKMELNEEIKSKVIAQIQSIVSNYSHQSQLQIATTVETLKCHPGEFIYHQNTNNQSLYIILDGHVNQIEEGSQRVIQQFNPKEVFGHYQFYTGFNTKTAAVSVGFVHLLHIKRSEMLQVLVNDNSDFQKFHQIQHNIQFNSDYEDINLQCKICKKFTHLQENCPFYQYTINLESIIKKEYFYTQDRKQYPYRRGRSKFNSLQDQKMITRIGSFYQEQHQAASLSQFSEVDQESQSIQKISDNTRRSSNVAEQFQRITSAKTKHLSTKMDSMKLDALMTINQIKLIDDQDEQFPIPYQQFHYCDIDLVKQYIHFSTHNNVSAITSFISNKKRPTIRPYIKIANQYSFIFDVVMKIAKVRYMLMHRSKKIGKQFATRKSIMPQKI